eukprot:6645660-Alexandrium_andersonii.AAC.1
MPRCTPSGKRAGAARLETSGRLVPGGTARAQQDAGVAQGPQPHEHNVQGSPSARGEQPGGGGGAGGCGVGERGGGGAG